MPLSVVILGHSGIGKSPLAHLFNVPGWEPFRVRKPRNAQDARVCMNEEDAKELEAKEERAGNRLYPS